MAETPFNQELKQIRDGLKNKRSFNENITQKILTLHQYLHESTNKGAESYEDLLWDQLSDDDAKLRINKKGRTIAYGIWHSTVIEDVVTNLLINDSRMILNKERQELIGSTIPNTGNQLSSEEIISFSARLNLDELRRYRQAVFESAQTAISSLTFEDMKRRFGTDYYRNKLTESKSVDKDDSANWLIDFWLGRDVKGLIMMPLLRHNFVHLNESFAAKKGKRLEWR